MGLEQPDAALSGEHFFLEPSLSQIGVFPNDEYSF